MRFTDETIHSSGKDAGQMRLGNLVVDAEAYRVWVDGNEVALTRMEFDLLVELARNADRVVTLAALASHLWDAYGEKERHRLTVLIFRIREKLQQSVPYQIRTRRGRGYGLLTSTRDPP